VLNCAGLALLFFFCRLSLSDEFERYRKRRRDDERVKTFDDRLWEVAEGARLFFLEPEDDEDREFFLGDTLRPFADQDLFDVLEREEPCERPRDEFREGDGDLEKLLFELT
jgi:hypothetical protein